MTKTMKRMLSLALALLLGLLAACGGAEGGEAADAGETADAEAAHPDVNELYARIQEKIELPEMIPLAEKRLQSMTGIDPAACPQALVAICGDGLRVDEIWLVEAADEDAAQAIADLANARVQQLATETENYLPDQYAVVSQARVLRIGSYAALFISPDAAQMEELFRAAF